MAKWEDGGVGKNEIVQMREGQWTILETNKAKAPNLDSIHQVREDLIEKIKEA